MKTEGRHPEEGSRDARTENNVVPLPRDWFGRREELVPLNGLVEREPRNGRAPQAQFGERFRSRKEKRRERHSREKRGAERETDGNFSHGWKTRDGQIQGGNEGENAGATGVMQAACRICWLKLKMLSNNSLKI